MRHCMQTTQSYIELTTLEQISDVITCLEEELQQWNIAEEIWIDLKLCVMEALQNAFLYGGSKEIAPQAKIMWDCSASGFYFTVEDNGPGIPSEIRNAVYEEMLKENGRGLFLMHAILDEVHFNEKGNAITGILRW